MPPRGEYLSLPLSISPCPLSLSISPYPLSNLSLLHPLPQRIATKEETVPRVRQTEREENSEGITVSDTVRLSLDQIPFHPFNPLSLSRSFHENLRTLIRSRILPSNEREKERERERERTGKDERDRERERERGKERGGHKRRNGKRTGPSSADTKKQKPSLSVVTIHP